MPESVPDYHLGAISGSMRTPFGCGDLMSGTLITPPKKRNSGRHFTLNPGTIKPPITGIAQFEPHSGTDNPLFDRKLLEYFLNRSSGKNF
jgi:hypothetical protein